MAFSPSDQHELVGVAPIAQDVVAYATRELPWPEESLERLKAWRTLKRSKPHYGLFYLAQEPDAGTLEGVATNVYVFPFAVVTLLLHLPTSRL